MAKGRKTGGRRKGTCNNRTEEVALRLAALGCDPLRGMVKIAADVSVPVEVRARLLGELARYLYPRPKQMDAPVRLPLRGALPERAMAVLESVSAGQITPEQGMMFVTMIAAAAKASEPSELGRRLDELELAIQPPSKEGEL